MELFHSKNLLGIRGVLLALWLILFVLSILLVVSGIKIERKSVKTILIIFGVLLALASLFLFMYTFVNAKLE